MYQKVDLTEEVNYDKEAVNEIKFYFKNTLSQSEVEDSGRSIASSYSYQPKALGVLEKSKLVQGKDYEVHHALTAKITAPISSKHISSKVLLEGEMEEEKMREFRKISKSHMDEEDVEICGKPICLQ
jgi:hypothetical protein